MKVLITGSSGFIGGHLVRALVALGYSVLGIDAVQPKGAISGWSFQECDLLNPFTLGTILEEFSPDCVVHLAARTDLDEKANLHEDYAVNIAGVENLVKSVRASASVRHCIYTSTQLVCPVGYVPDSALDYRPETLYGESKMLGEKIVRDFDGGGATWCIVRPTTVWGPGMNPHYQRFFRMVAEGRYFHVGRGPLRKSYGYVGNIAHQYTKLLQADKKDIHRKTFYLADYEPLSLRDWADVLSDELGSPDIKTIPQGVARLAAICGDFVNACGFRGFPFNSFRLRNVLMEYQVDLADIERICGSLPYTMHHGVKETVRWYQESIGR